MPAKKSAKKRASRATKGKQKAARKRMTTKVRTERKVTSRKKPIAKATARKKVARKRTTGATLGRPRVAGTVELDQMFRNDREAREVCEFLGVKTLKELEQLTPDEIVERLTAPVVRTVGRIRKALALNNRCLTGDQKFAVAFKKELS